MFHALQGVLKSYQILLDCGNTFNRCCVEILRNLSLSCWLCSSPTPSVTALSTDAPFTCLILPLLLTQVRYLTCKIVFRWCSPYIIAIYVMSWFIVVVYCYVQVSADRHQTDLILWSLINTVWNNTVQVKYWESEEKIEQLARVNVTCRWRWSLHSLMHQPFRLNILWDFFKWLPLVPRIENIFVDRWRCVQ